MSSSDVKHSREPLNQSKNDLDQFSAMEALFQSETDSLVNRLDAFPKYASRQSIAKFLTKYEIFRKILHVNGSIVEGGVLHGGGTLGWAKLSSILEPTNHTRKIIGFDTFGGFPSVDEKDLIGNDGTLTKVGELKGSGRDSVDEAVRVYDLNRPLSHIPKVELVQGDIAKTVPTYLEENPHLVVSLLYLDVDLYEPTKVLLETFLPRMPKGAIVVFDELNAKMFPGETVAVDEVMGLRDINIQRFPFDSYVSYAVLE
jgi:Macrocin-O-methyltransferase (TylF)